MKKVMLVDDEIVIRENIRDCVQWEREGFIYCGDASDGEVALPLIEKWEPDILITDIKMPFMNGLELSSIVRKRWPNTKIVILSGHDEFGYARSALQIGVEEYCLKPVRSLDLIKLLHAVGDKIDRERRLREERACTPEKLFGDLCGGLISAPEALEIASKLSLNLLASVYAVLICDLRGLNQQGYTDSVSVAQAERLLDERLAVAAEGWRYKRSRTERVWILKSASAVQLEQTIARIRDRIIPLFDNDPVPVVFGIGSVQDRLQGIHVSFLEAEEDRNLRRLSSANRRDLWHTAGSSAEATTVYLDRARFIEFLRLGTPSEARDFVRTFADGLKGIDWQASLYGYYLLNEIVLEAVQEAKKTFRSGEIADDSVSALQAGIRGIGCWEEACLFLEELLGKLWAWRSEAASRYGEIIAAAQTYIRREYANDRLSLQDAAEHVKVSPSHLSKVFSQETGQTFIEFLTQTRIRKAMELLRTTNDKSYEIAYRVGYNDAHYFSNLFKKMTGMTTREFRRQGVPGATAAEGDGDGDNDRTA
ncbi:response regulator [Cohnella hongkongensis]|uniref:Response regulator n=1 Tax=Cohnella hongkongensis TaxID=178337 RepID=A0ABV9F8I8_9BACL